MTTATLNRKRPTERGSAPPAPKAAVPLAFVAPRHRDDPDWKWVTDIGPMRSFHFRRLFIDNTLTSIPKLTRPYRWWQYLRAMRAIAPARIAFLFSDDVGAPLTSALAGRLAEAIRVYVGFTQDGPWPASRIKRFGGLLRRCRAVTMFTEEERAVYLERYGLEPERAQVIPIHTDETDGYGHYDGDAPCAEPYVLSLGSPNRRFLPVARACRALGIDLVVITRPWHENDALDDLAHLGAKVITDANKVRALTYLKHARLAVAAFDDPAIAGGFTTLVHAMFLRTPFVLTQCLGMAEHVIDGETGLITPHDDEAALRDAIERLWSEPGLAQRFGEAAYRRGGEKHSLEVAAEAFFDLTQRLLA